MKLRFEQFFDSVIRVAICGGLLARHGFAGTADYSRISLSSFLTPALLPGFSFAVTVCLRRHIAGTPTPAARLRIGLHVSSPPALANCNRHTRTRDEAQLSAA
jgi:hypothetical protein